MSVSPFNLPETEWFMCPVMDWGPARVYFQQIHMGKITDRLMDFNYMFASGVLQCRNTVAVTWISCSQPPRGINKGSIDPFPLRIICVIRLFGKRLFKRCRVSAQAHIRDYLGVNHVWAPAVLFTGFVSTKAPVDMGTSLLVWCA